MRKEKLLITETVNRTLQLAEGSPVSNKTLIVVDIQPEYNDGFSSFIHEFIDFLNENHDNMNRLIFLFNGADTLGMISEDEYKMWWIDNGLSEDIVDSSRFYDKGYAFFRYCIDSGIEDEIVANLVRHMMDNNVNDSRDLDKEFWDSYVDTYGDTSVRELLEVSDDCINIPDLMEFLSNFNNIVLCGGGINECLKEVEIALQAMRRPYSVLPQFTY